MPARSCVARTQSTLPLDFQFHSSNQPTDIPKWKVFHFYPRSQCLLSEASKTHSKMHLRVNRELRSCFVDLERLLPHSRIRRSPKFLEKGPMSTDTKVRLQLSAICALLACLPATGFVYGLVICDCGHGILGQTLGRVFVGFIEALDTVGTLGKPWDNEGGTSSTNIRPFVALAFLLIMATIYWRLGRRKKQN